ncbi:pyridoxal-phosphate dependent enzyme [Planktotalea sp.]|uniref:pyridoxal-phosphate dependent enzyme n=1 Tax=Planktotalea sp. TaxID=2029877 RepID=UPI0025EEB26C|nr:pyridoxal-phosphate dependent enzyme [Planktotalea sp.]
MRTIVNPYRGTGFKTGFEAVPAPSVDAAAPRALLDRCPSHGVTPMVQALALHIKDERGRMGLGSFKALGAAYVIAHEAQLGSLEGRTYITASAGNHGMSVAAGAKVFGAKAVIYLAKTVPSDFADRLREKGADVVIEGDDYEASMAGAQAAAAANGWTLLSDSSWDGYFDLPHRLMEGYLAMAAECTEQMDAPTHIFLQAGVGGLAGACAALFRDVWGDEPHITVVEPEFAPAIFESIQAGGFAVSTGPVSDMGRLDCKEASLIALKGLSRDTDSITLITEEEAFATLPKLAALGLASSTSGSAGITAALLSDLPEGAKVLCILSEGE